MGQEPLGCAAAPAAIVNDMRATMRTAGRGLVAFLVGVVLVWAVPLAIALVGAAPGLRTLILAIKASGLPRPETYYLLTGFLPALVFSFAIGWAMFRLLRGPRLLLWGAAAAPWVLNAIYFYIDLCVAADVSCLGAYEVAGLIVVPMGLLLAAVISKPSRGGGSVGEELPPRQSVVPRA